MKFSRFFLAVGALALFTSVGHASVITRTYDVTASAFRPLSPVPPYDAFEINFTVTFDDSMTFGPTTNGLKINLNTLPFSTEFEYDKPSDILTIGTNPVLNTSPGATSTAEYQNSANTFGLFIFNATSNAPYVDQVNYSSSDRTFYTSGVSAVTSSTAVSAVPLPASAPMFGAALMVLAGFGYGMNRWVAPKEKAVAAVS